MSIEWMTHVWNNSKQKGSPLLMLLAIADYADERGKAFPSIETLAQRTRQTTRNAIRILEKLEAAGEIKSEQYASPFGTNMYSILVSTKPKDKKPASKRSSDILGQESQKSSDIPVTQLSPDPSLTISDPSQPEKRGKPRTPRKPTEKPHDPLLDHPAVVAFRDIMHLTPNDLQRAKIAERVGNNGQIDRWRETLKAYRLSGKNPNNVGYALDIFDGMNGKEHGHKPTPQYTQHDLDIAAQIKARRADKTGAGTGGAASLQPVADG